MSCGGAIRDSNGCFRKGSICNIGSCSPLKAELFALLHGIQVARSLSISKVVFETDSSQVVDSVLIGSISSSHLKYLLKEIIVLLQQQDWQASVKHTFRESNKCANFLAGSGFDAPLQVQLVNSVNPLHSIFLNND